MTDYLYQSILLVIADIHFHLAHHYLKVEYYQKFPKEGDVIVFKTPSDNRTDYIKRLIGLPGDKIKFIDGDLHINNNQILKTRLSTSDTIYCGINVIPVNTFEEKLSNGKKYESVYRKNYTFSKL